MHVTATSRVSRAGLARAPASVRPARLAGRHRRDDGAVTNAQRSRDQQGRARHQADPR